MSILEAVSNSFPCIKAEKLIPGFYISREGCFFGLPSCGKLSQVEIVNCRISGYSELYYSYKESYEKVSEFQPTLLIFVDAYQDKGISVDQEIKEKEELAHIKEYALACYVEFPPSEGFAMIYK